MKKNKYNKIRKVARTLKTGVFCYNSEDNNVFSYKEGMIKCKIRYSFYSNNGNNIDWYIKGKIEKCLIKINK